MTTSYWLANHQHQITDLGYIMHTLTSKDRPNTQPKESLKFFPSSSCPWSCFANLLPFPPIIGIHPFPPPFVPSFPLYLHSFLLSWLSSLCSFFCSCLSIQRNRDSFFFSFFYHCVVKIASQQNHDFIILQIHPY